MCMVIQKRTVYDAAMDGILLAMTAEQMLIVCNQETLVCSLSVQDGHLSHSVVQLMGQLPDS